MSKPKAVVVILLAFALSLQVIPNASAAGKSKTGRYGQILTVSKVTGIKAGEVLKVTGNKFDETVGIYVALCVTPKAGALPTPCGGGVDQTGALGASQWISSNPPPYGEGLAIPFRAGGRFNVKVKVGFKIERFDCRKISCSLVVRADHLRSDDRSHDIVVPLQFRK